MICCVVAVVPMCSHMMAWCRCRCIGVGPTITSPAQHRQQSFSPLVGGLVAAAGLWLVLAMNLRWWCSNLEPPWQWPRTGELPGCLAATVPLPEISPPAPAPAARQFLHSSSIHQHQHQHQLRYSNITSHRNKDTAYC